MKRTDNEIHNLAFMTSFRMNIGKKCKKFRMRGKNPKPFKSGLQINTIKSVEVNPHTDKFAYSFLEDDSLVNCDMIIVIE